uniref:Uncharacterized protein n=2 Tax=Globodera rostochiensis TaxID=31243 RepID=A0A914GV46_GLORO
MCEMSCWSRTPSLWICSSQIGMKLYAAVLLMVVLVILALSEGGDQQPEKSKSTNYSKVMKPKRTEQREKTFPTGRAEHFLIDLNQTNKMLDQHRHPLPQISRVLSNTPDQQHRHPTP